MEVSSSLLVILLQGDQMLMAESGASHFFLFRPVIDQNRKEVVYRLMKKNNPSDYFLREISGMDKFVRLKT